MEQLTQAIVCQLADKMDRVQGEAVAIRKANFGYEIELKKEKIATDQAISDLSKRINDLMKRIN